VNTGSVGKFLKNPEIAKIVQRRPAGPGSPKFRRITGDVSKRLIFTISPGIFQEKFIL
jgi:hypothetical protein